MDPAGAVVVPVADCDEADRLPDDPDQVLKGMLHAEDRTQTEASRGAASGIAALTPLTQAADDTNRRGSPS